MESSIASLKKKLPLVFQDAPWVLVDCGAYKGDFTSDVISISKPHQAILIEANPTLAKELRIKFSGDPSIIVKENAVSNVPGDLKFNIYDDPATSSILSDPSKLAEQKSISVPTISLNALISDSDHPIFLKTDLQGYDLEILKSLSPECWKKIRVCVVEFIEAPLYEKQGNTIELLNLLDFHRFKIFQISDLHSTSDGQLAFGNFVFIANDYCQTLRENLSSQEFTANELTSPLTEVFVKAAKERLDLVNQLTSEIHRLRAQIHSNPKAGVVEKIKQLLR